MFRAPKWILVIPLGVLLLISSWLIFQAAGACPVRKTTGFFCPGCGGTRAALAISRGDVGEALSQNFFLTTVLIITIILGLFGRSLLRSPVWLPRTLFGILAFCLLFTLLRNFEAFSWLAPR